MFQKAKTQISGVRNTPAVTKRGDAAMRPVRLERCLTLIRYLESGLGYNVEQLSTEFGLSRRTLFRDLGLIRAAGFELQYDPDRNSYILPEGKLSTGLSKEDLKSLAMLLILPSDLWEIIGKGIERNVLLGRLLAMLRSSESKRIAKFRATFKASVGQTCHAPANSAIATIFEGIAQRRAVRIVCETPDGDGTIQTKVAPQRIIQADQRWGVLGRSSIHRHTCFFSFAKVRHAELTEDGYRFVLHIQMPPARWRF